MNERLANSQEMRAEGGEAVRGDMGQPICTLGTVSQSSGTSGPGTFLISGDWT